MSDIRELHKMNNTTYDADGTSSWGDRARRRLQQIHNEGPGVSQIQLIVHRDGAVQLVRIGKREKLEVLEVASKTGGT